jgi:alkanesulfonate monooxygenase SsuD/methylene tetrahydromethanopterin reductase-like flavin-dependent oxidoreductase (luciferase family)
MPREIHINAFDMACVGHIQEAGLFDGIFFADVVGVYDVMGGSPDAAVQHAVQVPVSDPLLLIPAMAAATRHLGFGVTANLTYEQLFLFARRMSTLDHLTQGRIGWNIVTGYLDSAARAAGPAGQMAHDDRDDLADEYMELVYRLWEGSWDDDAVLRDRASGVHADPSKGGTMRGKLFGRDRLPATHPVARHRASGSTP